MAHKKHFNFSFLRHAFQTALLNELQLKLGPSLKKVKASIYSNHKDGFYVYAKSNTCDPSLVLKYIGRYLARPLIATSRIDSYDGDFVTFHYNRHEDEKLVIETLPVLTFISRLIQHIPEKHFKMICYYDIYARHKKSDLTLRRFLSKEKYPIYLSFNCWRNSILHSFGYDPLECSVFGTLKRKRRFYYESKGRGT